MRERVRKETLLLLDEPYYTVLRVRCVESMRHLCINDVLRVTRFVGFGYWVKYLVPPVTLKRGVYNCCRYIERERERE